MKEKLRRLQERQEGAILLEASIAIITFLMFVLMLYGILVLFLAQNLVGHALIESTQSLAMETYATNKLTRSPGTGDVARKILEAVTDIAPEKDSYFSSRERWFDRKRGATAEDWQEAARERFIGYFAGGDKQKADEMLRVLRVKDGLAGLDFSDSNVVGSDVYIRVSYEIEYFFNPGGLGEIPTSQQACSRMWGTGVIDHLDADPVTAPGSDGSWIDGDVLPEVEDPAASGSAP